MTPSVSTRDRLRYAIDNTLAHGSVAIIAWLFAFSACIVLIAGTFASVVGIRPADEGPLNFAEATWASLVRTLDPGTMGADDGWGFRWLMLAVTLGGIFVISTLIGAISSGIDTALANLRKGRSRVIESDHTVILGWSPQVFTIVEELAEANYNRTRPRIAILGEIDKVAMEDEIRSKVPHLHNTRVICRTGSPLESADLEIVSVDTARSIIVLSGQDHDSDAEVIKVVLAITRRPNRRDARYHIVAAIRDPKNLSAARIAGRDDRRRDEVARDEADRDEPDRGEVEWVQVSDLVARIVAQTCRQVGLSTVYTELLNFEGDEIYFVPAGEFAGRPFEDLLTGFESSCVIGLRSGDGEVKLGPPMDRVVQADDAIILITADDDTGRGNGHSTPQIDLAAIHETAARVTAPEETVLLGWNWRGSTIIRELASYVPSGSRVRVVSSCEVPESVRRTCCPGLAHLTVSFETKDTTDRGVLDGLELEKANHVIVLSYLDDLSPHEADARTLITLLHLRDIAARSHAAFSIVTEVMDARTQRLAESAKVDDFIVSDRIVSQILAQVSEDKSLNAVFTDLFDPEGCEIYLKPAVDYVVPGLPVTFYTVVEAARRRGEIAIGYRIIDHESATALGHGVVINPCKPDKVVFGEHDRIVVVAEE